ncbi:MAG: glycosyltransferase family 9 protein [Chloroflexi bacterium]|nr:glycosyltransferase family 9 protein [Chloroflexota bacterium]
MRAMRVAYPLARLEALLTPQSARLLEGWDALDGVVLFQKAAFDRPRDAPGALPRALALAAWLRGRYDAVVLLHHLTTTWGTLKYAALALASRARVRAGLDNGRGWFLTHRALDRGFGARHEVDYWLSVVALLGAEAGSRRLEAPIGAPAQAWAAQRWAELGLEGRTVALLHPGSGAFSLARRWPAERFATVGDALAEREVDHVLVLAGPAPEEAELAARVAGRTRRPAVVVADAPGPQALAALLARCRLVVGNDSGVMHLAAAVGTPTVAVFGPSNDRAWAPYPATAGQAEVVRERLACSPCIHVGHRFGTPRGCPARTCLDLVEPEAVVAAAGRVLHRVPG